MFRCCPRDCPARSSGTKRPKATAFLAALFLLAAPLAIAGPPGPSAAPSSPKQLAPRVLNGVDVLEAEEFASFEGMKIGLITNHTGTDRQRTPTIDLLFNAEGVELKVLFSPEHGIRGLRDEKVSDSVDEKTGLPVYSLYGERNAPSAAQLAGLDALVFDIQDIGCRFYTYISTLGLCLEAASRAKIQFIVLDRVNPINGVALDGPNLTAARSFTAFHEIPVRHGMTVGELAKMFNAERRFNAELIVIPVAGWTRNQWFDQTGLPWTNPSPNMRSLVEAILYPGVGLLEMTNLSVGRGTGTPFEVVGAPYIDDMRLGEELNRLELPGVRFVPIRFTPTASTFKDKPCGGVSILLTDRDRCQVVDIGIAIAQTLHRLYPGQFEIDKLMKLMGNAATLSAIKADAELGRIRSNWNNDLSSFAARRARYLIYK